MNGGSNSSRNMENRGMTPDRQYGAGAGGTYSGESN